MDRLRYYAKLSVLMKLSYFTIRRLLEAGCKSSTPQKWYRLVD